jgi:ribose-phosphate pyrophosphokinase
MSEKINGDPEQYVVVAPDEGHLKPAARHAHALGNLPAVSIEKTRSREDSSRIIRPDSVQGVDGRTCLILDDMIDTAGTLTSAAETLRNSGATAIIAAATHGIFSDPGLERLQDSCIDSIIVTDTVPVNDAREALGDRLQVVSVAPLIGYSLMRRIQGLSVSEIFAGENYS